MNDTSTQERANYADDAGLRALKRARQAIIGGLSQVEQCLGAYANAQTFQHKAEVITNCLDNIDGMQDRIRIDMLVRSLTELAFVHGLLQPREQTTD
ncbi:hypothetical protein [Accumulibacter sp.]|uniref:hypothetical protein n=1 Tax=Accumulibacter sp. TaxID=2053492 RepID=UPI0025D1BB52|nr:hypothetical protein [Accumulibacter sp.]MCM8595168.1 hypothetical protein [Accumulibacter sp.]MCM8625613.1 hypothetical protein [Accumulibacter sp.]MDS4049314.1 hypothetical protein [Accumulibacter sp.]